MTTNLLISYPHIGFSAVYVSATQTAATFHEVENVITGGLNYGYKAGAAATSTRIAFDMGGSVTVAPDHFVIGRADLLQSSLGGSATNSVKFDRSTDGSAWTTVQSDTSFNTATLYGPNSQDYVFLFTAGSAYRYWSFLLERTGGGTSTFPVSKLYAGVAFDMGKDPDEWDLQQMPARESIFYSGSGAAYFARNESPIHRFRCAWKMITDSVKQSFFSKIVRYKQRNFVYLMTRTNHEILNSYRVIYCRLVTVSAQQDTAKQNSWSISAEFEEVIA